MDKPLRIEEFIALKFRYACHWNTECKYSDIELKGARKILEADLKYFRDEDKDLVIQSFASLIKSINAIKKGYDKCNEKAFQRKGESWRQDHKMTAEFNRVMQCFRYGSYGKLEHGGNIFPITEVIFKGEKTEDKIVLSGPILEMLREMFISLSRVWSKGDEQKLEAYSAGLYRAYKKYMMEWMILNAEGLSSQLIKNREEDKKETALNRYKYSIAYNVHLALKGLTKSKSSASYPSLHKRIIGKLLNEVELFEYLGYTTDKDIENFIKRGSPENLKTRINKPKK